MEGQTTNKQIAAAHTAGKRQRVWGSNSRALQGPLHRGPMLLATCHRASGLACIVHRRIFISCSGRSLAPVGTCGGRADKGKQRGLGHRPAGTH